MPLATVIQSPKNNIFSCFVCLSVCPSVRLSQHFALFISSHLHETSIRQLVYGMFGACLDRFASYAGQIQPMRGWCVVHHFQVHRQKVEVSWVIHIFAMSALWLHAYLTKLHMGREYNPRDDDVSRTIPCQNIKGQGYIDHLKFLPCLLRRSVPTDRVTSHVAQIQPTHNVMMCHAPFPAQKFRGQGVTQTVRSFCAVRSVWLHAFLIRWTSYMTQIQPMRGQCFAHYFQVKNPGHMGR